MRYLYMRLRLHLHEVYMLFTCYLLEFHFTYTELTIRLQTIYMEIT